MVRLVERVPPESSRGGGRSDPHVPSLSEAAVPARTEDRISLLVLDSPELAETFLSR